jgi:hypothetical protein
MNTVPQKECSVRNICEASTLAALNADQLAFA